MDRFETLALALIAGGLAGIIASAVMEGVQALLGKLSGAQQNPADSATARAASAANASLAGEPLPRPRRPAWGRAVHYATGMALGVFYGGLGFVWPPVALGFGLGFGVATWLVLDEILVPLLGLGKPPWKAAVATHAYGLAAHLAFGAALETARRLGLIILG